MIKKENDLHKSLENYPHNVRGNLYKLIQAGRLKNGKLLIFPVDQGFEHGPDRSFAVNPDAYDPIYLCDLAQAAGFNAFAAPLGILETCYEFNNRSKKIPLILKLNSSNILSSCSNQSDQAITSSVSDAIRLGCLGVGFTIYPGSSKANEMFEELREIIAEAKSNGLFTMVWSYPRGELLSKEDETSLDVISYAAHIGALLGAHIIKVKFPTHKVRDTKLIPSLIDCSNAVNVEMTNYSQKSAEETLKLHGIFGSKLRQEYHVKSLDDLIEKPEIKIAMVRRSCFDGKRMVLFSGGQYTSDDNIIKEISAIVSGGGTGSIIGRNVFQRSRIDAMNLMENIIKAYTITK